MQGNENIFEDDWRDTLRAHYIDVVRRDDRHTEDTLAEVLQELGFRADELRQLKLEATMRAEDMHDDFVPQLDNEPPLYAGVAVEADEEREDYIEEALVEETALPEADDEEPEEIADEPTDITQDDDTPPDPDAPQQMSLF